jgi:hypothetical protein
MRRLLSIATFVLALALVPAFAQRGGGGHGFSGGGHGFGGGGHGAFAGHGGGFSGHIGGGRAFSGGGGHAFASGHSFSGMRSGPGFVGRRMSSRSSFRSPSFRRPSIRGNRFSGNRLAGSRFAGDRFRGDRDGRFRHFGFNNCFGVNCGGWGWGGWPWWYAGYYDPWLDWWWWDPHSSYDEDRGNEIQAANEMNQQSLDEQQIGRKEDQDVYARSVPQPREAERAEAPVPPTVLVFRDQHKQEVQNYAIVGQTLWNFAGSRTQKIPLDDLDLPATVKANDDRGVDFRVPGA